MTLITKNVDHGKPLKSSSWRKIAIGTWKTVGDPSIYGEIKFDARKMLSYIKKQSELTGKRITVTHFIAKAAAETYRRHPELNCILRFGMVFPRKTIDFFFQVANDIKGADLSGIIIRDLGNKSIADISDAMDAAVSKVREKGDPEYKKIKGIFSIVPGFMSRCLINFSSFIMYKLNIWSPLLGPPKDSFGCAMITNIGSLGMDRAYAPLVPYSYVPALYTVGKLQDTAEVIDGEVKAIPTIRIYVTLDHRLIEGLAASKMAKTMIKIFADPERELAN